MLFVLGMCPSLAANKSCHHLDLGLPLILERTICTHALHCQTSSTNDFLVASLAYSVDSVTGCPDLIRIQGTKRKLVVFLGRIGWAKNPG